MKIVVVDDLRGIRRLVSAMLADDGFAVVETQSPDEALAAIDEKVALVVADVEMPGGSGVELIRLVKLHHPALPVIAMSAGTPRLNAASRVGATAPAAEAVHARGARSRHRGLLGAGTDAGAVGPVATRPAEGSRAAGGRRPVARRLRGRLTGKTLCANCARPTFAQP